MKYNYRDLRGKLTFRANDTFTNCKLSNRAYTCVETIRSNWDDFLSRISAHISGHFSLSYTRLRNFIGKLRMRTARRRSTCAHVTYTWWTQSNHPSRTSPFRMRLGFWLAITPIIMLPMRRRTKSSRARRGWPARESWKRDGCPGRAQLPVILPL